jgi:hypothetical protein
LDGNSREREEEKIKLLSGEWMIEPLQEIIYNVFKS